VNSDKYEKHEIQKWSQTSAQYSVLHIEIPRFNGGQSVAHVYRILWPFTSSVK
jgi:hypothetical protein